MRELLAKYKEILVYYDHQPLLFFWAVADVFNNQVLWTDLFYWTEMGQPETYWLYMVYLVISLGILSTLNKVEKCVMFVFWYLLMHIFSTIRFCVSLYLEPDLEFEMVIVKNLTITFVYFLLWVWIYSKMKMEAVLKKINSTKEKHDG